MNCCKSNNLNLYKLIGLTEVILAITMIVFLITKPKGLFPFREIGDTIINILNKRKGKI